jgi:single-strand DNA-binding protein
MNKLSVSGLVATTPRYIITAEGLEILSFRLASSIDGGEITNWYTVSAFRQLGTNARDSINKGDRVIVSGNIKVRDWDNGERSGTSVEIEADSLGHDLNYGTSQFARTVIAPEEKETPQHNCSCDKCDRRNN